MTWLEALFLALMLAPIVGLWLVDLWLHHRRRQ